MYTSLPNQRDNQDCLTCLHLISLVALVRVLDEVSKHGPDPPNQLARPSFKNTMRPAAPDHAPCGSLTLRPFWACRVSPTKPKR